MREVVGTHDIVLVTLDTLRYDVAVRLAAQGRTPRMAERFAWQERHAPGSFTFASHMAMLSGFLPTPAAPGPHPRLFAGAFPGSETTAEGTWTYERADLPAGLAAAGYHTVCVGGVGFFNGLTPLGSVLPGMFAEAHWAREFGVTDPRCLDHQIDRVEEVLARADGPVFLLLNVAALHQPNHFYLPGATGDSLRTHEAALEYVDAGMGRLFTALRRPSFVIVCSDHGTAYGEDGYVGHRLGHEVVWTVPYGEFVIT
ncbi:STM4013/SEN3800 family hydrolase [Actinocorallia sp. API 0066]|uniref:STM4013/SEN3800 family hydrolase n=1 Tax=Actinocorallia sp. API 0066 TaxID=2896846 RepID=UPI0035ABB963